ncbi:DUF1302 domain-containing protein [Pseudomonas alkylphenolica]|uniref:DUF1302 domain-containing protein n=1 Tax=Pseudomonas alkylphenolica TaxID=237609 RepID=A0A443ZEN7_9PSED|nr:DUF1302 domain-containing protein [Pseudomonas alkylphenolica]RWU17176.1 DUF1302 domain-containing protein [Pseudomonas alkylphenolica]
MTTTRKRGVFQPSLLAAAVALGASQMASAVDFNIGEIEGQFDSSLSIGASWAVRGADPSLISNFNSMGKRGTASSRTVDDNRLNFKKGETFSKIFKGVHDLELKYGDSGVFVRGKYWYDFELKDEHRLFYDIDDSGRDDLAKSSGAEFLDAFVYHNYTLGDLAGNVRLGKQVVSWGESTFIGNSINSINPIDVAALRRPGAEIKEGLIPVNMLYVSQGLTDNITAEAFYQLEWDNSVVDNCGTFFGNDGVPRGCNDRLVVAGLDLAPGVSDNLGAPDANSNVYIPRLQDNEPGDSGQYGLALRWYVPELHDTEFGLYAMNYHSRSPFLSTVRTTGAGTPASALNVPRNARYFIDYPEDIRLYGLSFQTTLSSVSLGGEVSYRPNMPLQLNTADLLNGTLNSLTSPLITTGFIAPPSAAVAGTDINGYKRMPVLQAQLTATQFFDQVMGASRLTLVGEVGYNRINGLGEQDGTDLRFGRSPAYGSGILPGVAGLATCQGTGVGTPTASNPAQQCNDKGFYTTNSWGYRLRAKLDYPNVIAGINLSPNLAWSHDVDGYGPNFEEGNKAISIGLDADYLNTYTTSLSYTDFFGGDFNTNVDRDYVALSFGVNF